MAADRDKHDPESIEHSAYIYGIDGHGRLATIYESTFKPADIVHDVPLLARH